MTINDELVVDSWDAYSFGTDSSWQTNILVLKTGSLRVQLGAWSLIRYIHYIDQGLSILPLRAFYKASLETFIEQTGQLWWSRMLQALLLQPKMGDQIFINNNPFFRCVSPLYSPFPRTMNLWNESSDIALCDLCPPQAWEHICACIDGRGAALQCHSL